MSSRCGGGKYMKVISRNTELPVSALYPHPDNPRKDVGDVTELADSIRVNGLFQNLTVVRGGKGAAGDPNGHTVIIGHRRLSAAKAAGLETVPCMIVEMDEREQAATMLLENMQRTDLTVYEQAQGFQMMLDLGETQDGIAEKTGFSKTTIRHRLKLLELDREEFRKAEERQPTLNDYIRLEKLTDPVLKNRALSKIGTSDFNWCIESCLRQQRDKDNKEEWLKYLADTFERDESENALQERKIVKTLYFSDKLTDKVKEELDKMYFDDEDDVLSYQYTDGQGYAYILGERKPEEERKPSYEESNRRRLERVGHIQQAEVQAAELRKAFVHQYASKRNNRALALRMMLDCGVDIEDIHWRRVAEMLGIVPDKSGADNDESDFQQIRDNADFIKFCVDAPDKVMLAVTADYVETGFFTTVHTWDGHYQKNEMLSRWYGWLNALGYSVSSDERALVDGTHECFMEE